MSKEATIIQSFNDVKRQYEYFVKGYDVTESVGILLKRYKEAYDKEKKVFAGIDGYLEAQKEYQSQIVELQSQLAEKEKEIERLKKEIKEPEEIWNANLAELKEEVKQKLAQEFTEKIDGMLKEKVKEKTIDLNNQIRLMQESQQIEIDKRQREVNGYLKVIRAYNSNENQKAIEQLEKVKELMRSIDMPNKPELYNNDMFGAGFDSHYIRVEELIDNQINELRRMRENA